jgi:signal transduction histidine kinase
LSANHDGDEQPEWSPGDESVTRRDERRRVARELHDSTSQLLVALQLQIHRLNGLGQPNAKPMIDECKQIIREIHEQIRALDRD